MHDAYGNLQSHSGNTVNPYQYTGQQFDSATGLYDLRAREYDPGNGRFLGQDAQGFDLNNPIELNRYLYTMSDPINGFDPSGHDNFFTYAFQQIKNQGFAAARANAFKNGVLGVITAFAGYLAGIAIGSTLQAIQARLDCAAEIISQCSAVDWGSDVRSNFDPTVLILPMVWGGLQGAVVGIIPWKAIASYDNLPRLLTWPTVGYAGIFAMASFIRSGQAPGENELRNFVNMGAQSAISIVPLAIFNILGDLFTNLVTNHKATLSTSFLDVTTALAAAITTPLPPGLLNIALSSFATGLGGVCSKGVKIPVVCP